MLCLLMVFKINLFDNSAISHFANFKIGLKVKNLLVNKNRSTNNLFSLCPCLKGIHTFVSFVFQ